jgi:putative lipoprotein
MRRIVWSLMSVAALALAGCNSGSDSSSPQAAPEASSSSAGQAAPAQAANTVSGTIALREGSSQPSADAKLEINLVDVSAQDSAPLASKTVAPANQFPVSFELSFNPADVNPADLYVVQANLVDGERHYAMVLQAPVLTKGAPNKVSIQLAAEQTPAEKQLAEFTALQKQIGGMKISSGSKLDKDVSRAWQVFRQGGTVRLVRMQADYGDKGFTSTDYAYQDGAPWVVVQQKKSSQDAKPNSTERAGWDKDGNLLLKQAESGGKTDTLGDDEAASLKKQAQDVLNMVTNGKGK